jgi:hypothetical protein
MDADEGRNAEEPELGEILEEMIKLQADLMTTLKDALNELTFQAGEDRMLTNRGSGRGLSSSYGRSRLHVHRRAPRRPR